MITAVALSPSLDVAYLVGRAAGIQRPTQVVKVAGGKALNAARAAASLGADVVALAVLGGPTGELVASLARADGVVLDAVAGHAPTRTCVSIHAEDGADVEVYEPAVAVTRDELDAVLASLDVRLAERHGWCLVSGGMPPGVGPAALADVLGVAAGARVRVAVDTHGDALSALLVGTATRPDLVKVNRAEAAEALGADQEVGAAELASELHRATGAAAVVTAGARGAFGHDADGPCAAVLAPGSFPVGRYPVGSGDSFLGGLVLGLDAGQGLAEAIWTATGAAVANAQRPGAGVLDPALARRLASTSRGGP